MRSLREYRAQVECDLDAYRERAAGLRADLARTDAEIAYGERLLEVFAEAERESPVRLGSSERGSIVELKERKRA